MKEYMSLFLDYYDREVVKMIVAKYDYDYMDALRKFFNSKTYKMISNIKLEMWDYGCPSIFEIWECEQIAGDPKTACYFREN